MTRRAARPLVVAAVLACGAVALAACGHDAADAPQDAVPAAPGADDTAARGRTERAFWASYDEARAALSRGDEPAARTAFERALGQRPDHAASLYALAGIEHRAGRFDAALALCDRLLAVERPRTRALLLRAALRSDVEAALASGRTSAARAWLDLDRADADAAAAETENPEETGPHVARGRIALLRNDLATAETCLTRALTIHPGHAEAMVLQSVVARRRGDLGAARAWVAQAVAATQPKDRTLPPGEGDTQATLEAVQHLDTARLRALAAALEVGLDAWPTEPPARPRQVDVAVSVALTPDPLRVRFDFDGDGVPDELAARRAPERDALLSLFGVRDPARGSFTLRLGGAGPDASGRDATADAGLAGIAACAARLVLVDADRDGRVDVYVDPGAGDPSRREPALLLRNARTPAGALRFECAPVAPR